MTRAQDSAWALAIVLVPLVLLSAAAAWNSGYRTLARAGLVGALLLALQAASGQGIPSRWLYLAQHAGVHRALAAWFGSTLRRGAEPLVSALARRVHGSFTPDMARYTRSVTLAWTLYFIAMATTSLVLLTVTMMITRKMGMVAPSPRRKSVCSGESLRMLNVREKPLRRPDATVTWTDCSASRIDCEAGTGTPGPSISVR
jgi:hypothetical protein